MRTALFTGHYSKSSVSWLALLSATMVYGYAVTGTSQAQAAEPATNAYAFEEIVVTSRHRAEKLQDIPETIQAFTATQIEDAGINNVNNAFDLIPNAVIFSDQQPGVQTVTIRGISQARGSDSEPGFAFVVDGVTSPTIFSFTQELYDIERIEIMKGPQGALYGRNAIGGVINVITKKPSNEFMLGGNVGYAEGDELRFSGRVSGPIVEDKLMFRLSGSYMDYDGQIENVTLNRKVDFNEEYSLRGQLLFVPSEDVDVSVSASYVDTEGGSTYYGVTTPGSFGAVPGLIQEDDLGMAGRELLDLSAKVNWQTGIGTLTSVTAYTDVNTNLHQDLDFTQLSVAEADQFVKLESWMQELRLSSPDDQRLRWSFGGFYQYTSRDINTIVLINANGPVGFLVGGPGGSGDPSQKDIRVRANRTAMYRYDSYALFGNTSFDVTDRLELGLSFRYDIEKRDFSQPGAAVNSGHGTFKEFQPKASISYDLSEDAMAYFTYSTGFRPGGFNPFIGYSPDGTYDKETTTNFELGVKSTWFDRRLTLNMAAFIIQSDNTHQRLLNVSIGQAEYFNIGDTEYKGFEVDAMAEPVDNLFLQASFGLTDSKVKKINPNITNVGGLNPLTFIGNKVPRVNDYTLTLAGQYEIPLQDSLSLVLRSEYRRLGKVYWYLNNVDKQPSYGVADFRVSLRGEKWSATGYVDNAFDKKWRVTFNNTQFEGLLGGINIFWPSPPRQFGVKLSYEFF